MTVINLCADCVKFANLQLNLISDYLLVAGDKKIKAIDTLLENDIKQSETVSIEQYNREIGEAMEAIKRGGV